MTNNLPWRPYEDAELQELWQDINLTATQIGGLLGRPRNSVIGRANRMRRKEGEERWPKRASRPIGREQAPKAKKPETKPETKPEIAEPARAIRPILPDRVTVGYTDRCFWTDCGKRKERGNYCKGHAEIMYQPRRA